MPYALCLKKNFKNNLYEFMITLSKIKKLKIYINKFKTYIVIIIC